MTSIARRAHPFTAGAMALAIIALAVILPTAGAVIALYLATCAIALVTGAGRGVRLGLMAVLPVWALLFVLQGVFGDGPRIAVPWGGTLSQPGLAWAVSQGSRLALIATASLAFASSFDPYRFLQAAIARHWPFGAAFLLVATLDAADRLGDQARRLREAQRTRGVHVTGSLLTRTRALPALMFPLLLVSLTEADDRALALETRGLMIRGRRTATDPPRDTVLDRIVRWLALASVLIVVISRLRP
ncbi:MAG: energy-coupling factor transporter transmembrane component T [Gemmatimonadales bacterium]